MTLDLGFLKEAIDMAPDVEKRFLFKEIAIRWGVTLGIELSELKAAVCIFELLNSEQPFFDTVAKRWARTLVIDIDINQVYMCLIELKLATLNNSRDVLRNMGEDMARYVGKLNAIIIVN